MKLNDDEKKAIIQAIESGRPLPDKYRCLLFDDKPEIELVWNGKTREVCNIILPFQVIEQVDEPRTEAKRPTDQHSALPEDQYNLYDTRGRQIAGWTNKLIWGDNKLVLSSLRTGPLRDDINRAGGLKLIYIDPPFAVGADFSMEIDVSDPENDTPEVLTKKPSVLEEIAYRDTWGSGADSFIAMLYERLCLMRDLLAEDGCIYVHCDWRMNGYIRLAMDEIFGRENFLNHISWKRTPSASGKKACANRFPVNQDFIFLFAKNKNKYTYHQLYSDYSDDYKKRFKHQDIYGYYRKSCLKLYSPETEARLKKENKWIDPIRPGAYPSYKQYLHESSGKQIEDMWTDINSINPVADERLDYPTQKPEALLTRILLASSNPGDLVADFFCGSGTTLAVAEKLGRKWIGCDLGKFAIHTTRKRMIAVQRELKAKGQDFRAFEILNLGKYERAHYIGKNLQLRTEEQRRQIAQKEYEFVELILRAYKAEAVRNFSYFHGKKSGRLITVGPIDMPVNRLFVEEILRECKNSRIRYVDILAFDFELGLFPGMQTTAQEQGVDLALKYIPRDVFDKRAVEKNQVVFPDVNYIEIKPIFSAKVSAADKTSASDKVSAADKTSASDKTSGIAIELVNFSVSHSQDNSEIIADELKNGRKMLVIERGQIIQVSKDANGIIHREILTKKWKDWIDYWAVDFNFEQRREIIRVKNPTTGQIEEQWTGDYIFENEWQSFRTKKEKRIELCTPFHECPPGLYKIAVKVVDILGNDTMKVISVTIP